MSLSGLLIAALLLCGMAGVLAALALLSGRDEQASARAETLAEALPGLDCTRCGHAGCLAYAMAVAEGRAETDRCQPGGEQSRLELEHRLGRYEVEPEKYVAFVRCAGGLAAPQRYAYDGPAACAAAAILPGGGPMECRVGCLGLGSCARSCPVGAIDMVDGVARVNRDKCNGCMRCISVCPRHIIEAVPRSAAARPACAASWMATPCDFGCDLCGKCVTECRAGAISIKDGAVTVDDARCTGCGRCADVCERGVFQRLRNR
ncbi:MAG TPA: 4Fe-4S binding protein [Oscillospiraceae bacterium]|nr:4Fe-4S binding protein [Oscillospiraceae bacterium]